MTTNLFGLRPYQQDAIVEIEQSWAQGIRSIVYQLPTGGGKSRIIRTIVDDYSASKKTIYVIAHRNTLVKQLSKEISEADIKHGIIKAGSPFIRYRVQVCSMQTLIRRMDKLPEPAIVIIDECFPAGTVIDGAGPIENINIGDTVTSYDEHTKSIVSNKVTAIMSHIHQGDLIQIISCGKAIICTRNHPILTRNGWKKAEDIGVQDELLHNLWETNTREQEDLLEGVPEQIKLDSYVENKPNICVGQADKKQCNVDTRSERKGTTSAHRYASQATNTGRKWKKATCSSSQITKCSEQEISRKVCSGICCTNKDGKNKWISNLLQNGHRLSLSDVINRSRRYFSSIIQSEGKGQEKNSSTQFIRVDSTQVLKQGSPEWLTTMHRDNRVYNIEVERTNTYLVNGIVVHNCHHAKSASYVAILKHWSKANLLGLSATPCRSDGKGLDDTFQKLIQGPTVKQLMADNYLSDYEYYAPAEVDMSGVKIQSGEYNSKEATSRVDKHYITGSAVEHYKRYADHMPAIACCVTIAHSEHVAQEFRDAGYKAIAVNSRMDAIEVERSINGLKTGTIEILCQCEMLGEGVDVPGATVLIGLRPTASLVIYLQHIGRVLRKSPGKDKAIILDHVGNWSRFGLPDDDRVWSLEGKGKKAKEASTLKRCPDCLRPVAIATRVCPYCGYQWTETADAVSRLPEEKEGQLVNIRSCGKEEQNSLTLAIARGAHSLKQAIAIAKSVGYEHKNAYAIWVNILHNNA